jgi:hypothetical protein
MADLALFFSKNCGLRISGRYSTLYPNYQHYCNQQNIMNHTRAIHLNIFVFIISWCVSLILFAASTNQEAEMDTIIPELYHKLDAKPALSMDKRIDFFSAAFLDKPYLLGALGEGAKGQFDQFPLYRPDAFDCETYVDTVVALALASNLKGFQQCINQIRYKEGNVSFIDRNHFASLDWNGNNQKQGITKDITLTIKDQQQKPIAEMASALINKPNWYQHLTDSSIKIDRLTKEEKDARLTQLKAAGKQFTAIETTIPYLPLTKLFNEDGQANEYLFKQVPNGAIIEIVRPNWDLTKMAGTHLNVSHLGFAIWKNDVLMYREASSIHNRTIDVPLIEYLREALESPTIKGINVQVVEPKKPLADTCVVAY